MHLKSLTILIFFLAFSNIQVKTLNDKIYDSQKMKIKGSKDEIEIQHEFRKQYIEDIIKLKKQNPKDTIIVVERYPVECSGCPAKFVQVYSKKERRGYELNYEGNKVSTYRAEPIETLKDYRSGYYNYLHSDLKIIMEELKLGKSVEKIVQEYNTENCFDGSTSIYSILFPNNRIESMGIRCLKN